MSRLLKAHEVAERLGVSRHRVYELIRTRKLPAVYLGRSVRVDAEVLEEWIRRGGTAAQEMDGADAS